MPVLKWAAHFVRATLWLAFHLAIATGLFLLSAHLSTQPDEDSRNGAHFARVVASFWFYIAAWSWVVRGVLQRPVRKPDKGKPTGAEAARGALGCLANLIPLAAVFVFGRRLADWAWTGISSGDTSHPARRLSDELLYGVLYAMDHAGEWVPWLVAFLVLSSIARAVLAARRTRADSTSRRGSSTRREDVQSANQATLEKLRSKGKGARGQRTGPAASGRREVLAEAGKASAEAVGVAHAGAHGPDMSRFQPAARAREDRVLGALTYSSSDGGWWARREDREFAVQIEGEAEGPEPHALELGRQVVQRSFEALLRASEAARPVAQARGVGLPRFTIAAVRVGSGTSPDVTVHLRCDADPGREYVVASSDNLNTFKVT